MIEISQRLSEIMGVEDEVIGVVSEVYDKPRLEVERALTGSDFRRNLYNMQDNYYKSDIELLILEFIQECATKNSWLLSKAQAEDIVSDALEVITHKESEE